MTHIIKLLYGTDKRNPTRTLSLTDLDASIYLATDGMSPGAGPDTPLFSGRSSRFDGERIVNTSRGNTQLKMNYSIAADNTQQLQIAQNKISRFFLECKPLADRRKKVWLEYRWSIAGLDDIPRPVIGQLNYYLEILNVDVKQWPNNLHSGQLIGGTIQGVVMDIIGQPYWEGLEQRAPDTNNLADVTDDTTLKHTLGTISSDEFALSTWLTHKAADYEVFENYVNTTHFTRMYWDQSDARFEVETYFGATSTAGNSLSPIDNVSGAVSIGNEIGHNGIGYAATFTTSNYSLTGLTSDYDFQDTDFSLTVWIKFSSVIQSEFIVCSEQGGSNFPWQLYQNAHNGIKWSLINSGAVTSTVAESTVGPVYTAGVWYFIYVYHDATANEIGISIDDNPLKTTSHSGGATVATSAGINVGSHGPGPEGDFEGAIDDLAIFDRVLTAAEVTEIYASNRYPSDIYSFWDLGESGTAVRADTTNITYNGAAQSLTVGTDYHLAMARGESELNSFVNGVEDTAGLPFFTDVTGSVTYGSAEIQPTDGYTSTLDAARGWAGTAPTAAQLLALYTAEAAIKTAGDVIQYPLYFNTYQGAGNIKNTHAGSSLFGYWKMEEDTTADRVDSSSSKADLTPTGSIARDTGKLGSYAADFEDGDTRYMSTTELLNFRHSFTICAWIKLESSPVGNNMVIVSGRSETYGGTNVSSQFALYYASAEGTPNIRFYVRTPDQTFNEVAETTISTVSLATWYFVVATYDALTGVNSVSVNNNTFDTNTQTIIGTYEPVTKFTVGGHGSLATLFDGLIDDVSVWSKVLSATEITALYNSGTGAIPTFDNGNGSGILYGISGDSPSKIRLSAQLPTTNTDRAIWTSIHQVDSSTLSTIYSMYMPYYSLDAAATSGSGTDTEIIEQYLVAPGELKPGRYQILADMRITAGSATNATVKPYYRIGATTSPEVYASPVTVASNANFLFQNLGTIDIDWPMDTLDTLIFGLHYTETAAVAITPAINFIMLMPEPGVMVECEDSTITITSDEFLNIDERRAWSTIFGTTAAQKYHFHFTGKALRGWPHKYNYLFFINGADNQTFEEDNDSKVRVYVTPRWALPGGMAA